MQLHQWRGCNRAGEDRVENQMQDPELWAGHSCKVLCLQNNEGSSEESHRELFTIQNKCKCCISHSSLPASLTLCRCSCVLCAIFHIGLGWKGLCFMFWCTKHKNLTLHWCSSHYSHIWDICLKPGRWFSPNSMYACKLEVLCISFVVGIAWINWECHWSWHGLWTTCYLPSARRGAW